MSFTTHPIKLEGSRKSANPLRTCGRCGEERDPGGGVDVGPGRWHCASCWTSRRNPGNNRDRKA
jgi:hypothetical protein